MGARIPDPTSQGCGSAGRLGRNPTGGAVPAEAGMAASSAFEGMFLYLGAMLILRTFVLPDLWVVGSTVPRHPPPWPRVPTALAGARRGQLESSSRKAVTGGERGAQVRTAWTAAASVTWWTGAEVGATARPSKTARRRTGRTDGAICGPEGRALNYRRLSREGAECVYF